MRLIPGEASGIPTGLIALWSGLLAAIPSGWQICDGTNGTPDMRGKFVRGAPAATEAGATGGSDTVTLTTAQLAVHAHNRPIIATDTGTAAYGWEYGSSPSGSNATDNAGSGSSHENKPAYKELIFIMKM